MIRLVVFAAVVCILMSGSLCAEKASSLYEMKMQYREVEMIEIVPGVVVRSDIWPDDYVPTVEDFLALGVSYEELVEIFGENPRIPVAECTWGQIKLCFLGIPNSCCPELKGDG